MTDIPSTHRQLTPVDDVRLVRQRHTRQAGGDIKKLAQQAARIAKRFSQKLELRSVDPSTSPPRRNKAAG
jgi:hypothetical protein